ncbi:bifunctional chorismate-binding protein/class IV aminotransferase [Snodgrassella sp. CFCC 13594]|uniref:bifunctional chorismate-binding protein/class IV aminotransferase n=1 Tax=Snodgrassella sp. CFCC 13594 TaxID=1775559 RepID=UPI00082F66C1|nr:bifunctional chorismate-binding protein/class IV aminotransferase [Snodgrassella sp. CFCC 13594]
MPTHPIDPGNSYFALLDDANASHAVLLTQWQSQNTLLARHIDELDATLHQGWQQGWHALLVLPYATGHEWQKLCNQNTNEGVLHLYWFQEKQLLLPEAAQDWLRQQGDGQPAGVANIRNNIEKKQYIEAIERIQAAIACGDTYQINYTTRLHFTAYGHPCTLYQRLRQRQPVPYGMLCCLPHSAETQWILCFSPELFLCLDGQGGIHTQPMKGTAPIAVDDDNDERAQTLQNDAKNRAENVMIVDLLRNDLGKIAKTGSVEVPEAFAVRAHGQVWQMTSTISAQLRPNTTLAAILRATFPCGSITGAPKRISMQLIDALETSPRGLYTGSIGHLMPAKGEPRCQGWLNVAIRTLQLTPQQEGYDGEMGVGSGIVADSRAEEEYTECQWKSHFLTSLPPVFDLIETMRVDNGHCALLPAHILRLTQSARSLGITTDAAAIHDYVQAAVSSVPKKESYRLKIILDANGCWQHEFSRLTELSKEQTVLLHPDNCIEASFLARHKTTSRRLYDAAWHGAQQEDAFDTLLFDQQGYLLEGGRSNVFVLLNGEWHTPSLQHPLLNGVMRQAVLVDPNRWLSTPRIHQTALHWRDLQLAEAWLLTNALRGIIPITRTKPLIINLNQACLKK